MAHQRATPRPVSEAEAGNRERLRSSIRTTWAEATEILMGGRDPGRGMSAEPAWGTCFTYFAHGACRDRTCAYKHVDKRGNLRQI